VRDNLARDVFPVLRQALLFRDRLQHRRPLNLETVQAHLRGKLLAFPAERADGEYLGVRFPVVCWLDEINCLECGDPDWQRDWGDHSLEYSLYSSHDRAHLFWEQARLATRRSDPDVMEAFYLCMLLGFRGDLRGDPRKLADWRDVFETEIGLKHAADWPEMPHRLQEPEADVPVLTAKDRLRWVLLAWALAVSVFIVGTAAFLMYRVASGS
jgi:type VI secretion system protein ImpK